MTQQFKLSAAARTAICIELLKTKFATTELKLVGKRAAFAARVYEAGFSAKERALMESLPEGWLPEDTDIKFQVGTSFKNLYFNGAFDYREGQSMKRRFPKSRVDGCIAAFDRDELLGKRWAELEQEEGALNKEREALSKEIMTALNSTASSAKLIEMWPEIAPIVAKHTPVPVKLPAIKVDRLNTALGLKPVKKAA